MKPELSVDLSRIRHNAEQLLRVCRAGGLTAMGITKGCCGSPELAGAFVSAGMDFLADSRIDNLKKLQGFAVPKVLLRLPGPEEAAQTVHYAEYSLNTQVATLCRLSEEAVHQHVRHRVILMIDIGDLREGIWIQDEKSIHQAVQAALTCEGLELAGIGTNLTCYGGIIPTVENYTALCQLAELLRRRYGIELPIVSGGNSSSIELLLSGRMPAGITNLRINQAVLLGRELAHGQPLAGWHDDAFTLTAGIVEIQVKPSRPVGELATGNAFGPPPRPADRGMRRRAILSIGRQEMDCTALVPLDAGALVVGASSDHMIVDISDSALPYRVGDRMAFRVSAYGCVIAGMASPYIHRVYRDAPARQGSRKGVS
ncbi:MAG: alanine/ornithine racemase family PLP-dependent enzyme [Chloroflexi bacterium]|nr:alanine/ornithine racemase family PLP-dependent enzyme [Chloroflexota bacterium]